MGQKYHARNALIYFDDTDFSGQSNSLTIGMQISDADTSCFGDDSDRGLQGPYAWSAQFSGFSQGNGSTGLTDKLFALATAGTKKFLAYPQGSGAGNHYFYGLAYLTGMPITAQRKDAVTYQASLKSNSNLFNYASA